MGTMSCNPALMYRENGVHPFAQILARPVSIFAGRSFDKAGKEFQPSLLAKIAAVALTIIFLPIALPAIGLGLLILSLSSAHKKQFEAPSLEGEATSVDAPPVEVAPAVPKEDPAVLASVKEKAMIAYEALKNGMLASSNEWTQKTGKEMDLAQIRATRVDPMIFAVAVVSNLETKALAAQVYRADSDNEQFNTVKQIIIDLKSLIGKGEDGSSSAVAVGRAGSPVIV